MVFGIFGKKPQEKMQAKPAVKPRPPPADLSRPPEAEVKAPVEAAETVVPPPQAEEDELESLDFTGIQLAEETDPLQAVIEQAAIAYANADDETALIVLSEAAHHPDKSAPAERVWLMLFDLLLLTGNRGRFTEIELEFAQRFEKQPPVWKDLAVAGASAGVGGAVTAFRGDLVGGNATGFDLALQALEKGAKLRLDLSKVKAADADGCERLLELLGRAGKLKREVELLSLETLCKLLSPKVAEQDPHQSFWRLLLEALQRQGKQEEFENLAVDFAIAFEISPPSYELPPRLDKPPLKAAAKVKRPDDAFYMEGEILGGRIDGLDAYVRGREQAVIDMAGVTRIDFVSAGQMLNVLTPHWQNGISITLRHPNRLVAELLAVVGAGQLATIVFAKK